MAADDNTNRLVTKQDAIYLGFILTAALLIGVYLILTTVLISKDGVFYIEQAKKFQTDPVDVIKEHSFGYPFLIFVFHKLASVFTDNQSIYVWIYSAQAANLFCRLAALIPLYFIGKLLVGSKTSLAAVLLLVILPYPAQYGSDVLRDWPHILFLVTGFLFLLLGAGEYKYRMFGAAGFVAGLGFMVRPECAQLVIYGILWLLAGIFLRGRNLSKRRFFFALSCLLVGFLIPAASYVAIRGSIPFSVPQERIVSSDSWEQKDSVECEFDVYPASILPGFIRTVEKVFWDISDNLMYFFMPVWMIGICYRFRKQGAASEVERFFIPVFIVFNIIILIFIFSFREYLSRRYGVPLVVVTIFYVPIGLWAISDWLGRILFRDRLGADRHYQLLLLILLGVGVFICSTRLFRPIRPERRNYLLAAQWLAADTGRDEIVGVPDKRISFYAEREGLLYKQKVPERVRYVVSVFKTGRESGIESEFPDARKVFYEAGSDEQSGVAIYDLRNCVSEKVSFEGYRWEKVGDGRYTFSFIFKTKDGFDKDWAIYFHGRVKDGNAALLPEERRKSGFANWDFCPTPVTSKWPDNEYVTITREISAKPIPYNFELGFYTGKEGLHGRRINLGWIDLGEAEKGEGI